jgi:glycine dehydrogenase
VVETRAEALGLKVIVADEESWSTDQEVAGILLQYPDTEGTLKDLKPIIDEAHKHGVSLMQNLE